MNFVFLVEFERALVLFRKRNLKIKRERRHRFDKSFCFFLISKKKVVLSENKTKDYSLNVCYTFPSDLYGRQRKYVPASKKKVLSSKNNNRFPWLDTL